MYYETVYAGEGGRYERTVWEAKATEPEPRGGKRQHCTFEFLPALLICCLIAT